MKISKKWKKKMPGDLIILHNCNKNHDHMLYCSWHIARDRCNCYFSFWAIFGPFNPLRARKIKIKKKKRKKCLEILSFYASAPKIMIICYTVSEIWHVTQVIIIFHCGLSSFYTCIPKIMIRWCMVPETWCVTDGRTEGQTDGWMEKVTCRGGYPIYKIQIKKKVFINFFIEKLPYIYT